MQDTFQIQGSADPVTLAVARAKAGYERDNPGSRKEWEASLRCMPGGNTRSTLHFDPFPLHMVRGEGCRLWDADGHEYVDFLSDYTSGIFGHSNKTIYQAVQETLARGMSLSAPHKGEQLLAGLICERFPSIEQVRFTNSGTEANLMALTTAITFTDRKRILVFQGAYHGGLLAFTSAARRALAPYDFAVATFNDIEGVRHLIRGTHDLAAILVEPMLGASGCIPAEPGFLRMLVEEGRAAGAVVIFDEIQTSRLSAAGRQGLLNLKPDLTTLGKYFGGGFSVGAFGGRRDLMSMYDPRHPRSLSHPGTFNNNVMSMAAGYAGLSVELTAERLASLNASGELLRNQLGHVFETQRAPFFMTGLGSLMNIHVKPDFTRRALDLLFFDLLADGIYLAPRGLIALSLAIGEAERDLLCNAIGNSLKRHRDVLLGHRI